MSISDLDHGEGNNIGGMDFSEFFKKCYATYYIPTITKLTYSPHSKFRVTLLQHLNHLIRE